MRVTEIIVGYVAAVLCAGAIFTFTGDGGPPLTFFERTNMFLVFSLVVAILTIVPFLAAAAIAENNAIRNPVYYVMSSAATSAVAWMILAAILASDTTFLNVGLASSIPCGLIYWLIAGRKAGSA